MLQISDADITRVERILLPPGCVFNEERRDFIRCMESRDVVACPGSGKTTALLAKLLILASNMPFLDGRGICVLTHTNIAVDEIKRQAGGAADALFHHPSFFGTIQAFVNRFLTIPAYRNEYKQPVQSIDNDPFFAALAALYRHDRGLQRWMEPRGGVETLGKYWFKPIDMSIGRDLDNNISNLSRDTPTYGKIESIRGKVLGRGILSYNDAYSLGLHYLTHFPSVIRAIRHRFRFVFIDEMQDTDDHQLRILDSLFPGYDTVILQRLGDPNQAIYQSDVKQGMLWSPNEPALPFSDSLRYGASIAKILDTVRVDRALTLLPNQTQHSLPPHMLLFDSGAEHAVLPAFGALIREHSLHKLESPRFRAVGWVGKDKTDEGKVCLRYYYPDYQQTLKGTSRWFQTLLSYMHAMVSARQENPDDAGALVDIAFEGVVRALRVARLHHPRTQRLFTSATLKRHLRETDENLDATLRLAVSKWVIALRRGILTADQLRDAVSAFVPKHFLKGESPDLKVFLESDEVEFTPSEKQRTNTYVSDAGDDITVSTVHSVKGETHTATLYLETFNYALDSKRLLPFCLGRYPDAESKKARHRANLKVAHVAFSRPTHLLAFACCSEYVSGQESELENAGWVIRKIGKKG